jgi:hypothetical protein
MCEGRDVRSRPSETSLRAGAAGTVQAARRQATRSRSTAERQARRRTAQGAAVSSRSLPGPRHAAGSRRRRQPAPALRVPGNPRSHAHDGTARGLPHRPAQHPADACPPAGGSRRQACARPGDAGLPDLRRQAPQRSDQPGQAGSAAKGRGVPRPLPREIITSPRQARHALSYVANNWRKHQEDLSAPMSDWTIDWFSSAAMFTGWAEYGDEPFLWRGPPTYDPLIVYQPKTWLLREGWKKSGPISCREVPSAGR